MIRFYIALIVSIVLGWYALIFTLGYLIDDPAVASSIFPLILGGSVVLFFVIGHLVHRIENLPKHNDHE